MPAAPIGGFQLHDDDAGLSRNLIFVIDPGAAEAYEARRICLYMPPPGYREKSHLKRFTALALIYIDSRGCMLARYMCMRVRGNLFDRAVIKSRFQEWRVMSLRGSRCKKRTCIE